MILSVFKGEGGWNVRRSVVVKRANDPRQPSAVPTRNNKNVEPFLEQFRNNFGQNCTTLTFQYIPLPPEREWEAPVVLSTTAVLTNPLWGLVAFNCFHLQFNTYAHDNHTEQERETTANVCPYFRLIILTAIKDHWSFEALNVIGIDQLMQLTSVFLVLST